MHVADPGIWSPIPWEPRLQPTAVLERLLTPSMALPQPSQVGQAVMSRRTTWFQPATSQRKYVS